MSGSKQTIYSFSFFLTLPQLVFTSPYIEQAIERVALNAKVSTGGGPGAAGVGAGEPASNNNTKMLAISYGSNIRLWAIAEDGTKTDIGTFSLTVRVEYLFFIGSQLVALSSSGKIGVWHSMTQHFQTQELERISSFDTAGSFLLLGCNNGSIYYIGKWIKTSIMQVVNHWNVQPNYLSNVLSYEILF